ncbi:MAG: class I SAM-dependent methyltransferase [Flavobacterium sp.]|uniref:THUMP-like domain-containing protein n=1 Tax=Flavobacterium sp. TaxID=239 RepID=UPI001215C346|nr:class I SAM-dependent methyltransferase [Flavobacterium sp.]RZJ67278.1 MAG: class I SAM-dependent methyltransferase [Flavobacterium sp.]
MDKELLSDEIQAFIDESVGTDVSKLALLKNPFPDSDYKEILNQIAAKTKAKDKLPTWFSASEIYYPAKVSVEQTSSEKTADYKANLISGHDLIDLTGGFGVDDYYFSKRFEKVVHCELDLELSGIAAHNFDRLKAFNVRCETGDSTEILKHERGKFDWIYIDPSRRNETKGKVFMLRDCLPNVPDLLDFYFGHSDNILIKTAPILDISAALSELKNVREIHIVALENEVKELLFVIQKNFVGSPNLVSVNITKDGMQRFESSFSQSADANYGNPKTYLYEPNAAIMKSGAFDAIGLAFDLDKLHKHSHLYTSDEKIMDFPGRIFEVKREFAYDKANMKNYMLQSKANVSTRNFPETVEALRKKWKIRDGGDHYCFFTTVASNDKIVLFCAKI